MTRWEQVAAPGTDPGRLATAVALAAGPAGRAALTARLEPGDQPRLGADDPPAEVPAEVVAEVVADPLAEVVVEDDVARRADEVAATWARLGVVAALRDDPAWPRLRCAGPPPLLAWRGRLPDGRGPVVAVVGQRRATGYGRGIAAWLAEAVGAVGGVVVSGGAVGIDAAAHEAAVGTGTVVVLGCGHDVHYPRPHARPGGLFERVVAAGGALVAEQLPGARALPWAVRARNRIVAGLADAVVVVEGGARSGALLTATAAADAGVPVLAVPGDVRAPGSVAPHRLLAEGAAPCTGPQDLWDVLGRAGPVAGTPAGRAPVGAAAGALPAELLEALVAAWPRPRRSAELAVATGLPIATVLAAVTRGSVAGLLAEGVDGVRLRRAPSRDDHA